MNVRLDDATFARAQELAAARHCTVEELLRDLVLDGRVATNCTSGLVGLLADEPELVDQILEDVYRTRETQPLRTPPDGSDPT